MSAAKSDEESHPASLTANGASRNSYLDRLVETAKEELVYADAQKNTILNLATLQRMLLFHLQVKIIQKVGPLVSGRSSEGNGSTSNGSLDGLETDLAAYAQAVRDWELMADYQAKYAGDSSQDPFCISSKAILTSKVMTSAGLQRVANQDAYARGTLDKQTGPFSQRNRVNTDRGLKAFLRRFAMALFGGVALVGPMLLMVLHKDRTTDLSTTSVAVFIFAVVVACYSDATPEAIVGTVAAYAAVLTVFVGTLQSP